MYVLICILIQSQIELSQEQDNPLQNLKFTKNTFPAQYNYAIQVQQCEILPLNRHNTHSLLLQILRFLWQCGCDIMLMGTFSSVLKANGAFRTLGICYPLMWHHIPEK
jgi:hypothetical protein